MPLDRRRNGQGFSLVELVVVLAIMLIILAIAVPRMVTTRNNAAEVVVIREIQTIHEAQMQYMSQFGDYAATLAELGPPANGTAGPRAAYLIPASLASGEKDGYTFTMTRTPTGYAINANPKIFGTTGRRTFYLDQDGIVHQNWGQEPATVNSPELK